MECPGRFGRKSLGTLLPVLRNVVEPFSVDQGAEDPPLLCSCGACLEGGPSVFCSTGVVAEFCVFSSGGPTMFTEVDAEAAMLMIDLPVDCDNLSMKSRL